MTKRGQTEVSRNGMLMIKGLSMCSRRDSAVRYLTGDTNRHRHPESSDLCVPIIHYGELIKNFQGYLLQNHLDTASGPWINYHCDVVFSTAEMHRGHVVKSIRQRKIHKHSILPHRAILLRTAAYDRATAQLLIRNWGAVLHIFAVLSPILGAACYSTCLTPSLPGCNGGWQPALRRERP